MTRHNFEEGHSVFERSSDDHHDHMVCTDSGKIIEFFDEELEELQKRIAAKHGYQIKYDPTALGAVGPPPVEESQSSSILQITT